MALSSSSSSSLSFILPDIVYSSPTHPAPSSASASKPPFSLFPSLWTSTDQKAQFVLAAGKGKGKRESLDFFLGDAADDDLGEDEIPDDVVDMAEWIQNRPPGFGLNKEYDLTLEEKLLVEIEADKKARETAKLRAKAGLGKTTTKAKPKVTEAPAGVEVWVGNLPRKRKVERDLRSAFRNAPGLLHIRPILEPDNEKTREPMCRGFAFFTFATEDDAYDFVSQYSEVKVKFGKVEKKVACEVAKSDSPWHPNPDGGTRASSANLVPRLQVRETHIPKPQVTPPQKLERKLEPVTAPSSVTDKSFAEGIEEGVEVSETELRAMEEEIWDQFEDDDDKALDLELASEESSVDEEEEEEEEMEDSAHSRSAVTDEDEVPEPVGRGVNVDEEERISGRIVRESLDVDEDDYSIERIKELEAKVREMEKKLQLSAQTDEERVALLEKRVLGKARAAIAVPIGKKEEEKKKTQAAKKKSQAAKKSPKPRIGGLGSSSRLKAKERAILTGVLSKYVSSPP